MIAALAALLLWQGAAQPAAPPAAIVAFLPAAAAPAQATIRAGTAVRFVTEGAIDSRAVRQGQRFGIVVDEDIRAGDLVILPKGTRAVGEVEAMTERGNMGRAGSLSLRPLFLDHDGQRIYFDGLSYEEGKGQVGEAAAATFLLGGLGLIVTGKSAQVPAGTAMIGTVRGDVNFGR